MAQLIKPATSAVGHEQDFYEKELERLSQPAALEKRLSDLSKTKDFRRIYVMGCGRSGTWLLTAVMHGFDDLDVIAKELPVEHFGLYATNRSVLVIKRDFAAYEKVKEIPPAIELAYIVRHPFDVLTSHLAGVGRPYYVLPARWLGEMSALQYLVTSGRKNTKIIRYEDLVCQPLATQRELAAFFSLRVKTPLDQLATASTDASGTTVTRAIDRASIGKHKSDPAKIEYLRKIKPELGDTLKWVADTYGYDVSLPNA
jgi:hypothetical protein